MIQNISQFSDWFVTENDRAKALVKYELNSLRSTLRKYLESANEQKYGSDKVRLLCNSLVNKYGDYLQLLDYKMPACFPEKSVMISLWAEHFNRIFTLEQKLASKLAMEEEKKLLLDIISLYQCVQPQPTSDSLKQVHVYAKHLKQLFCELQPHTWLLGLIEFWNLHDVPCIELAAIFREWSLQQQQKALDYFSEPTFVDLVNAIFFYKLHPDKLFTDLVHYEKLISIRMRLGVLHYYIESIQQQLYGVALQNGLIPAVDYLLHDEELPEGLIIDVCEEFREIIQTAIKQLKVNASPLKVKQVTLECLYDLEQAYKFWFNPNRLIDVALLLKQNLLPEVLDQKLKTIVFQEKMIALYGHLSTAKCLTLYGYFANNDSRYLLCTFFTIAQGGTFDWLPLLNEEEKSAVSEVFTALYTVMDALRKELINRNMITNPYTYDLVKPSIQIGQRNRDAVFRTIAIYRPKKIDHSDILEQLFRNMEEID